VGGFLLRKAGAALIVVVCSSMIVFAGVRALPGDPAIAYEWFVQGMQTLSPRWFAAGGGFTATGTYGVAGETDVVVWTLAGGTAWTEAAPQGTGLAGPGMQAITALTATGATLTGVGFTAASASMLTEPTIWQSPVRS